MLVYIAGPYTGQTKEDRDQNIRHAAAVAARYWDAGHTVICPHTNSAGFDDLCVNATWEDFLRGDLVMISVCDQIVMLPNWEQSRGAGIEHDYARERQVPVHYMSGWYEDALPLHPTEVRSPVQVKAFREVTGHMMRTHLRKNFDYSPANILATGEVGLVTRLWDKTARLLNLIGFRLYVTKGDYEAPRDPKNESIDDTYDDMAVYAVIGKLLRHNQWGH